MTHKMTRIFLTYQLLREMRREEAWTCPLRPYSPVGATQPGHKAQFRNSKEEHHRIPITAVQTATLELHLVPRGQGSVLLEALRKSRVCHLLCLSVPRAQHKARPRERVVRGPCIQGQGHPGRLEEGLAASLRDEAEARTWSSPRLCPQDFPDWLLLKSQAGQRLTVSSLGLSPPSARSRPSSLGSSITHVLCLFGMRGVHFPKTLRDFFGGG